MMKIKRGFISGFLICVFWLSGCGQNDVPRQEQDAAPQPEQYEHGIQYLEAGNYEEAIAAFSAAIASNSEQAPAYSGRGDAYVRSGETEENLAAALADYQAALALDETIADAWLGMADVYIRQGDYDQALEILRNGLEKTEDNPAIADKIAEIEAGNIADSAGNLRQVTGYSDSGELAWYHVLDYNESGQASSVTTYDAAGNQTSYMEFLYDAEGRNLDTYTYDSTTGEVDGRIQYEYDSAGNMVRSERSFYDVADLRKVELFSYNAEGICTGSEVYRYDNAEEGYLESSSEYDDQGNVIRQTNYDPNGTMQGYYSFEYDQTGNVIRQNICDANGQLWNYVIWMYDNDGNCTGRELYDGDGSLQSSTANEFS